MKTTLALALAAPALAQLLSATPSIDTVSVLAILATAVPSSILNEALTNPAAVSSQIQSQFAAHETPAWFQALPVAVQSYLVPATTIDQAPSIFLNALPTAATYLTVPTPKITSSATPLYLAASSPSMGGSTRAVPRSSVRASGSPSSSRGPSSSSSAGASATTGPAASASPSTGAAPAMPTVLGAGLAGVVGLAGLLAL